MASAVILMSVDLVNPMGISVPQIAPALFRCANVEPASHVFPPSATELKTDDSATQIVTAFDR